MIPKTVHIWLDFHGLVYANFGGIVSSIILPRRNQRCFCRVGGAFDEVSRGIVRLKIVLEFDSSS